jgi:hypothetical protein
MTGPQGKPLSAEDGRLRASHADRELVIEALRTAFVDGRLAKGELDARAGLALVARTYADLAVLIADIPPGQQPAARPARASARVRRPLAGAAVKAGTCLVIGAVAWWIADHTDTHPAAPGPHPFQSLHMPMAFLFFAAGFTAVAVLGHGVVASWQLRRSRGQLPPRPGRGPGGRVLEGGRPSGVGHDRARPGDRGGQVRAGVRAGRSRPDGRRVPARPGRAVGGVRSAPGAA